VGRLEDPYPIERLARQAVGRPVTQFERHEGVDAHGRSSFSRGDDTDGTDLGEWNALPAVPAVKSHRVFMLRGEEFVVPGPRVAAATERLARLLHPEAFK